MINYLLIAIALYVAWKIGYSYGHHVGLHDGYLLGRGSQNTYIIEQHDNQWEFKKHKLN